MREGGTQILIKVKPQSRFVVFGVRWICRASTILLWARFGATSFTLADSRSTWCPTQSGSEEM